MPRSLKKRLMWLAVLVLCFPYDSEAAAWLQKEGNIQLIDSVFHYSTTSSFNKAGDKFPQEKFTKIENQVYMEWGLRDDVTVGFVPSYQYLKQKDRNTGDKTNQGFSDADIFVRKLLWNDASSVFSIQPLIKIPGFYDEAEQPALGNRQFDFEMRGLYGKSFSLYGQNHFTNIEMAYRKRTEEPSDEIRFDATLGIRPEKDITIMLQSFNIFSSGSSQNARLLVSNSESFDLSKLQVSSVFQITDSVSLQVGLFKHIRGENTGAGGGGLVSIWADF